MNTDNYFGWLEQSGAHEISPASVWSLDEAESASRNRQTAVQRRETPQHKSADTPDSTSQVTLAEVSELRDGSPSNVIEPRSAWWMAEVIEGPAEEESDSSDGEEFALTNDTGEVESEMIVQPSELEPVEPSLEEIATDPDVSQLAGLADAEIQDETEYHAEAEVPVEDVTRIDAIDESLSLLDETTLVPSPRTEKSQPRPRRLDESRVLPNEASFATVRLYQETSRNQLVGGAGSRVIRILPMLFLGFFGIALIVLAVKVLGSLERAEPGSDVAAINTPVHEPINTSVPSKTENKPATDSQSPPARKVADSPERSASPIVVAGELPLGKVKTPDVRAHENVTQRKRNPTPTASRAQKERVAKTARVAAQKSRIRESVSRTEATTSPVVTSKVETSRVSSGGGERPRRVHQHTTSP